jgi:hypothetical protein
MMQPRGVPNGPVFGAGSDDTSHACARTFKRDGSVDVSTLCILALFLDVCEAINVEDDRGGQQREQ